MNLELLKRKRDYYNDAAPLWMRNIWSRKEALDHFIKYNRQRLTSAGAVVKIGRDYLVHSEKFSAVAIEILGIQDLPLDWEVGRHKGGAMS